jgi:menaquinone-9 beta-reductase
MAGALALVVEQSMTAEKDARASKSASAGAFDVAFDVAILGAGPAGSCAAIAAARTGARVLLIDRAQFPRDKVCGCCLAPAGVETLRAIDAGHVLDGAIELRSVRLACATRELTLRRNAGVAIGRDALDSRLIDEARRCGVDVRLGTPGRVLGREVGRDVRRDMGRDMGRDVVEIARGDERICARVAIAADGLSGTSLDGNADFTWRIARKSRIGFGATIAAGAIACGEGEILMRVARGGYIGAVELPSGAIDVAAAIDPARLRQFASVADCARDWLGARVLNTSAVTNARWKGTPLLTRRRACVAADGILVAGDAAGYIEPFTGEGMSWAIATGAAAGVVAAQIARGEASWTMWPALYASIVGRSRTRCRVIALLLRSPMLVRALISIGNRAPEPFEAFSASIGRRLEASL